MYSTKSIFLIIGILTLFIGCLDNIENVEVNYYTDEEYQLLSEKLDLPRQLDDFSVTLPDHLFFNNDLNTTPFHNNAVATLGRVLFYDTRLSVTGAISCASCHQQQFAFGDDKVFSEGINKQFTTRNSLALAASPNLSASYDSQVSQTSFGWDHANRESSSQSKAAMLNSLEMGNTDMNQIVNRLKSDPVYTLLTRKAFSTDHLDEFIILHSLDAFMNSISSFDTKFDVGLSKTPGHSPTTDFPNFTVEENRGKSLFLNHCANCHGEKLDIQVKPSANNGLDEIYGDNGIGILEGPAFNGMFKIPFLRNIALTAPYMHDGRFKTLKEVVEHYNSGIQMHPNLDHELTAFENGAIRPKKLNLTTSEVDAMVAFLHTLTDQSLQSTQKYGDPFK